MLLDASPRTREWRDLLTLEMRKCAPPQPLDEPVFVQLTIFVQRPLSHYGTGRNADRLKRGVPDIPKTGLDTDKVLRACNDAAKNAGWFVNDSRVAECHVRRCYAETEGVVVEAWALESHFATSTAERAATPRGRVAR
jgi:Holliday junction resolvase RusA-like endonuclease